MSDPNHLNFVFIPFMAPGHILPMIDMAQLLSKRGAAATIVLTNFDAARFGSAVDRSAQSGQPIRLLKIRFPSAEAGLPAGCESADTLPSHDLLPNFSAAIKMLQHPVETALNGLRPAPSCIVSDKLLTWTAATCRALKLPRIVFDGMSCFTQVVTHNLCLSQIYQTAAPNEPFLVPGLPDEIELTRVQLPGFFNPGPKHVPGFREEVRKTELEAYGVVVNTFEEAEKKYVDEFRSLRGGKVWCIGPLSLCSSNNGEDSDNRVRTENEESSIECLKWLDTRKPNSVVYACLGSMSSLSLAQFIELAFGLEVSGHPFILVVRGGSRKEEIWKWIRDEGIEERTGDRGFFVRDWAPQVAILSHPGVGAFLTHCGWNSTLEGICAGVAMVTWPMFGEQFLNEKLIVRVLGVGVGVGARGVVHVGEEEGGNMVIRDGIKEGIERVMDEGDEGCKKMRRRVGEIAEIAKRSVGEGGCSWMNVEMLIQDIRDLMRENELV